MLASVARQRFACKPYRGGRCDGAARPYAPVCAHKVRVRARPASQRPKPCGFWAATPHPSAGERMPLPDWHALPSGRGSPPFGRFLRNRLPGTGWGDVQNLADRLDPMTNALIVNEADHGLNGRSSSRCLAAVCMHSPTGGCAKQALALRSVSLACRCWRNARSSSLILSRSALVAPSRPALSRSA